MQKFISADVTTMHHAGALSLRTQATAGMARVDLDEQYICVGSRVAEI